MLEPGSLRRVALVGLAALSCRATTPSADPVPRVQPEVVTQAAAPSACRCASETISIAALHGFGAAVAGALGVPMTEAGLARDRVRCDELAAISTLTVHRVVDLDGVDLLCGLESLTIHSDTLADLDGLEALTRLAEFRLLRIVLRPEDSPYNQRTPVATLRPLQHLLQLQVLVIEQASVRDLSPLVSLTELRHLELRENLIESVASLSQLPKLDRLDISSNQIQDLSPLSSLVALSKLDVGHNPASEAGPLSALENLVTLDLQGTAISDVSALAHLPKLTHLNIGHTNVSSLEPLAQARALQSVDAQSSRVESGLSALLELPALTFLNVCSTPAHGSGRRENLPLFRRLEAKGVRVIHHPKCNCC